MVKSESLRLDSSEGAVFALWPTRSPVQADWIGSDTLLYSTYKEVLADNLSRILDSEFQDSALKCPIAPSAVPKSDLSSAASAAICSGVRTVLAASKSRAAGDLGGRQSPRKVFKCQKHTLRDISVQSWRVRNWQYELGRDHCLRKGQQDFTRVMDLSINMYDSSDQCRQAPCAPVLLLGCLVNCIVDLGVRLKVSEAPRQDMHL